MDDKILRTEPQHILGIDFTSAPRPHKPITVASAWLGGDHLRIESVERLQHFAAFEALLRRPGPWVAGMDFPFAQPRALVEWLGWPRTWAAMVALVVALGKAGFLDALTAYRAAHPPGAKHPLRAADRRAGAISPLMVYGVPVGRMFFEGAPRLLDAGVHLPLCHETGADRVAVEVYPALAARRWAGRAGYKHDQPTRQTTAHRDTRAAIIAGLLSDTQHYGLRVTLDAPAPLIDDPTGDSLDAVLGAVQAAWAARRPAYGIPAEADPLEGWICDPLTEDNPCSSG